MTHASFYIIGIQLILTSIKVGINVTFNNFSLSELYTIPYVDGRHFSSSRSTFIDILDRQSAICLTVCLFTNHGFLLNIFH